MPPKHISLDNLSFCTITPVHRVADTASRLQRSVPTGFSTAYTNNKIFFSKYFIIFQLLLNNMICYLFYVLKYKIYKETFFKTYPV
jgi:hypothetical protein